MNENKSNRTVEKIKKLIDVGLTKTKIARRLGLSDTTISYAYNYDKQISS